MTRSVMGIKIPLKSRERDKLFEADRKLRRAAKIADADNNDIGLRNGTWYRRAYDNQYGSY